MQVTGAHVIAVKRASLVFLNGGGGGGCDMDPGQLLSAPAGWCIRCVCHVDLWLRADRRRWSPTPSGRLVVAGMLSAAVLTLTSTRVTRLETNMAAALHRQHRRRGRRLWTSLWFFEIYCSRFYKNIFFYISMLSSRTLYNILRVLKVFWGGLTFTILHINEFYNWLIMFTQVNSSK